VPEHVTDEEIEKAVRRMAGEAGAVQCAAALILADELHVPPERVGAACDRLGIRIRGCRLGLFP